jgi:hypothetical protein
MILILTLKSASALDVNNFQKSYLSLQLIGLADGLSGFRACQSDVLLGNEVYEQT